METRYRLFFRCPMAQVIWCWMTDNLGWVVPSTSLNSLVEEVLEEEGSKNNGWKVYITTGTNMFFYPTLA